MTAEERSAEIERVQALITETEAKPGVMKSHGRVSTRTRDAVLEVLRVRLAKLQRGENP